MARPSPQTDRVVTLVELLRAHPGHPLTLAEVTRRLGVNKSTCHAMLTALVGAGWLLRDPVRKTYRLGPALVAVGRAAAEGFPSLELARATMVELSTTLRLDVSALAVVEGAVTVLDHVPDPLGRAAAPPVGLRVGMVFPLRPPFGAAAVAWGDEREREAWLSHVRPDHVDRHRAALDATRARGFAVELNPPPIEEVHDVLALLREGLGEDSTIPMQTTLQRLAQVLGDGEGYVATALGEDELFSPSAVNAPVLDHRGRPTLVVSLTGFEQARTGRELTAIGQQLVAAVRSITVALSGQV